MVSNANDMKNIDVFLPNGTTEQIQVENYYTTVMDLKDACECITGIPSEIQKLYEDLNQELQDSGVVISTTVRLEVPIWWNKIICSVMNNEVQSVYRRVQLPMQQVGQNERIFVALFMSCARGKHEIVSLLVQLENDISLTTCTDSGKTLLHACAVGGSVQCLDIVVKHLLNNDDSSFELQDNNKESAYKLAVRLGNKEIANQLLMYSKESSLRPSELTKLPHQKQANQHRKTNINPIINERFEYKDKHHHESSERTNIASNEIENDVNDNQTSFKSLQNQPLVRKPCLKRPKENNGGLPVRIRFDIDSQDDQETTNTKRTTFLPSLIENGGMKFEKQKVARTASLPNSPFMSPRSSPVNDVIDYCKSAPNSPLQVRRTFRAAGLAARFALAPSPPRIQATTVGENLGNLRRGSLAVISENEKNRQRKKSRSVCEVTFRDSLGTSAHKKIMESEERQELPWNAWIAAKKQEGLAPMPEENQLKPPQSPGQSRRRSFVQWLNDKDLDALRKQHASLQGQDGTSASGKKTGKSFEEWLEDKHMESKREKEREKEKEEAMKTEQESKMRRRRMSQQKYQSWLQAKELKALEAEEKLLGEAKNKLEKMKIKWEEEDEIKKGVSKGRDKVNVGRTNSCPAQSTSNSNISRQRFHSLQSK